MITQYLPLTEYSSKYKVSISTLRRRIKAEEIKYVFEEGKYMILDEKPSGHQGQHRPSQVAKSTVQSRPSLKSDGKPMNPMTQPKKAAAPKPVHEVMASAANPPELEEQWNEEFARFDARDRQEPILTSANRLLTDLKKAYTQVLQEKEEQILSLKEEVSDLKTLVRVLEAENARSKKPR